MTLVFCLIFQEFSYGLTEVLKPQDAHEADLVWARCKLSGIPESVATIEDAWQGSEKLVILIQDAHTNPSAQIHEAKLLDHLLKKTGAAGTIFLEAGEGDESLSFLRPYASLEKRTQVSKSFLMQGRLQGVEYLDLTSDHKLVLYGVEDMELYSKAVELYRNVRQKRDRFQTYLEKIESTVQTLRPKILNPFLLEFDNERQTFLKERISLNDYLGSLFIRAGRLDSRYKHLQKLKDLKAKEAKIDFTKANEEQERFILSLPEEERRELTGALKCGDRKVRDAFYCTLAEKIKDPSTYPNLSRYLTYIKEARGLDPKAVLEEQKALEKQIVDSLIISEEEKAFLEIADLARLTQKMTRLEMTPEEFSEYRTKGGSEPFKKVTGFLNKLLMERRMAYDKALFLEEGHEEMARLCADFYELTLERDQKFIANMLPKLDPKVPNILITGGYHAPNLKSLLKKENISYISVTPQILEETNIKRYEEILLRQKLMTFAAPSAATAMTMPARLARNGDLPDYMSHIGVEPAFAARLAASSGAKRTLRIREVRETIGSRMDEVLEILHEALASLGVKIPTSESRTIAQLIGVVQRELLETLDGLKDDAVDFFESLDDKRVAQALQKIVRQHAKAQSAVRAGISKINDLLINERLSRNTASRLERSLDQLFSQTKRFAGQTSEALNLDGARLAKASDKRQKVIYRLRKQATERPGLRTEINQRTKQIPSIRIGPVKIGLNRFTLNNRLLLLKDLEGRYAAIEDTDDPDNFLLFEIRDSSVKILGERNERLQGSAGRRQEVYHGLLSFREGKRFFNALRRVIDLNARPVKRNNKDGSSYRNFSLTREWGFNITPNVRSKLTVLTGEHFSKLETQSRLPVYLLDDAAVNRQLRQLKRTRAQIKRNPDKFIILPSDRFASKKWIGVSGGSEYRYYRKIGPLKGEPASMVFMNIDQKKLGLKIVISDDYSRLVMDDLKIGGRPAVFSRQMAKNPKSSMLNLSTFLFLLNRRASRDLSAIDPLAAGKIEMTPFLRSLAANDLDRDVLPQMAASVPSETVFQNGQWVFRGIGKVTWVNRWGPDQQRELMLKKLEPIRSGLLRPLSAARLAEQDFVAGLERLSGLPTEKPTDEQLRFRKYFAQERPVLSPADQEIFTEGLLESVREHADGVEWAPRSSNLRYMKKGQALYEVLSRDRDYFTSQVSYRFIQRLTGWDVNPAHYPVSEQKELESIFKQFAVRFHIAVRDLSEKMEAGNLRNAIVKPSWLERVKFNFINESKRLVLTTWFIAVIRTILHAGVLSAASLISALSMDESHHEAGHHASAHDGFWGHVIEIFGVVFAVVVVLEHLLEKFVFPHLEHSTEHLLEHSKLAEIGDNVFKNAIYNYVMRTDLKKYEAKRKAYLKIASNIAEDFRKGLTSPKEAESRLVSESFRILFDTSREVKVYSRVPWSRFRFEWVVDSVRQMLNPVRRITPPVPADVVAQYTLLEVYEDADFSPRRWSSLKNELLATHPQGYPPGQNPYHILAGFMSDIEKLPSIRTTEEASIEIRFGNQVDPLLRRARPARDRIRRHAGAEGRITATADFVNGFAESLKQGAFGPVGSPRWNRLVTAYGWYIHYRLIDINQKFRDEKAPSGDYIGEVLQAAQAWKEKIIDPNLDKLDTTLLSLHNDFKAELDQARVYYPQSRSVSKIADEIFKQLKAEPDYLEIQKAASREGKNGIDSPHFTALWDFVTPERLTALGFRGKRRDIVLRLIDLVTNENTAAARMAAEPLRKTQVQGFDVVTIGDEENQFTYTDFGANVLSVKLGGRELLWHKTGGATLRQENSALAVPGGMPFVFPFTSRIYNGRLRMPDGRVFYLRDADLARKTPHPDKGPDILHGFTDKVKWQTFEQTGTSVTLLLHTSEVILKNAYEIIGGEKIPVYNLAAIFGDMSVYLTYTITKDKEFITEVYIPNNSPDREAVFSYRTHSFLKLGESLKGWRAQIPASRYVLANHRQIPWLRKPFSVDGTVFDFREGRDIGKVEIGLTGLSAANGQIVSSIFNVDAGETLEFSQDRALGHINFWVPEGNPNLPAGIVGFHPDTSSANAINMETAGLDGFVDGIQEATPVHVRPLGAFRAHSGIKRIVGRKPQGPLGSYRTQSVGARIAQASIKNTRPVSRKQLLADLDAMMKRVSSEANGRSNSFWAAIETAKQLVRTAKHVELAFGAFLDLFHPTAARLTAVRKKSRTQKVAKQVKQTKANEEPSSPVPASTKLRLFAQRTSVAVIHPKGASGNRIKAALERMGFDDVTAGASPRHVAYYLDQKPRELVKQISLVIVSKEYSKPKTHEALQSKRYLVGGYHIISDPGFDTSFPDIDSFEVILRDRINAEILEGNGKSVRSAESRYALPLANLMIKLYKSNNEWMTAEMAKIESALFTDLREVLVRKNLGRQKISKNVTSMGKAAGGLKQRRDTAAVRLKKAGLELVEASRNNPTALAKLIVSGPAKTKQKQTQKSKARKTVLSVSKTKPKQTKKFPARTTTKRSAARLAVTDSASDERILNFLMEVFIKQANKEGRIVVDLTEFELEKSGEGLVIRRFGREIFRTSDLAKVVSDSDEDNRNGLYEISMGDLRTILSHSFEAAGRIETRAAQNKKKALLVVNLTGYDPKMKGMRELVIPSLVNELAYATRHDYGENGLFLIEGSAEIKAMAAARLSQFPGLESHVFFDPAEVPEGFDDHKAAVTDPSRPMPDLRNLYTGIPREGELRNDRALLKLGLNLARIESLDATDADFRQFIDDLRILLGWTEDVEIADLRAAIQAVARVIDKRLIFGFVTRVPVNATLAAARLADAMTRQSA